MSHVFPFMNEDMQLAFGLPDFCYSESKTPYRTPSKQEEKEKPEPNLAKPASPASPTRQSVRQSVRPDQDAAQTKGTKGTTMSSKSLLTIKSAEAASKDVTVNLPLLKEVLGIQTCSDRYWDSKRSKDPYPDVAMRDYLFDVIDASKKACKKKGTFFLDEYDEYGNMYLTKGKPPSGHFYPGVAAHIDTVHKIREKFFVQELNGILYGMDGISFEQAGIGGDDKVGVYCALELLMRLPYIKVAFFRDEEIGCLGALASDMGFWDDAAFILQADRKGSSDFITKSHGALLQSAKFLRAAAPALKAYGYKEDPTGMGTDVSKLKIRGLNLCVANLSCGYYKAHGDKEIVVIWQVERCLRLMYALLTNFTNRRWTHTWDPPKTVPYNNSSNWNGSGTPNSHYRKPEDYKVGEYVIFGYQGHLREAMSHSSKSTCELPMNTVARITQGPVKENGQYGQHWYRVYCPGGSGWTQPYRFDPYTQVPEWAKEQAKEAAKLLAEATSEATGTDVKVASEASESEKSEKRVNVDAPENWYYSTVFEPGSYGPNAGKSSWVNRVTGEKRPGKNGEGNQTPNPGTEPEPLALPAPTAPTAPVIPAFAPIPEPGVPHSSSNGAIHQPSGLLPAPALTDGAENELELHVVTRPKKAKVRPEAPPKVSHGPVETEAIIHIWKDQRKIVALAVGSGYEHPAGNAKPNAYWSERISKCELCDTADIDHGESGYYCQDCKFLIMYPKTRLEVIKPVGEIRGQKIYSELDLEFLGMGGRLDRNGRAEVNYPDVADLHEAEMAQESARRKAPVLSEELLQLLLDIEDAEWLSPEERQRMIDRIMSWHQGEELDHARLQSILTI